MGQAANYHLNAECRPLIRPVYVTFADLSGRAVYGISVRVRIPPGTWMSVSCECCVMLGRGF